MFRLAARSLVSASATRSAPVAARMTLQTPLKASSSLLLRSYASGSGLKKEDIEKRVMEVMKGFEKVEGAKLSPTASFTKDLGLDSLDAVEVVMAIEEEFAIEIPDEEADAIESVGQAIDYIAKTPEAH